MQVQHDFFYISLNTYKYMHHLIKMSTLYVEILDPFSSLEAEEFPQPMLAGFSFFEEGFTCSFHYIWHSFGIAILVPTGHWKRVSCVEFNSM